MASFDIAVNKTLVWEGGWVHDVLDPQGDFLVWLAGFFEGESSCGCYHHGRGRYRLEASISQKERSILDTIKQKLGIGLVTQNKGSYGLVFHWRAYSADARRFLNEISPLLRISHKLSQVGTALGKDQKFVGPRHTRRDPITDRLIKRNQG